MASNHNNLPNLQMASTVSDSPSTEQLLNLLTNANPAQEITINSSNSFDTEEMLKNLENLELRKEPDGRMHIRTTDTSLSDHFLSSWNHNST